MIIKSEYVFSVFLLLKCHLSRHMFLKHSTIFKFENMFLSFSGLLKNSYKNPEKTFYFFPEETASFFSSFSTEFQNKIITYKHS